MCALLHPLRTHLHRTHEHILYRQHEDFRECVPCFTLASDFVPAFAVARYCQRAHAHTLCYRYLSALINKHTNLHKHGFITINSLTQTQLHPGAQSLARSQHRARHTCSTFWSSLARISCRTKTTLMSVGKFAMSPASMRVRSVVLPTPFCPTIP